MIIAAALIHSLCSGDVHLRLKEKVKSEKQTDREAIVFASPETA